MTALSRVHVDHSTQLADLFLLQLLSVFLPLNYLRSFKRLSNTIQDLPETSPRICTWYGFWAAPQTR